MSTIQELEQKIRRLEQQIIRQEEATKALLAKSDKALDVAMNAYRIDHHGYVWVWDKEKQQYRKTDVCVRVIIPKVKPKEITNCKIDDKAVNNRTLDDKAVDQRVLNDDSVLTHHIKDKSITPSKVSSDFVDKIVMPSIKSLQKRHDVDIRSLGANDADLQNQINSLAIHGMALSNVFGDDPYIGISQKALTDAFNKVWQKMEDITGEILQGFSMVVTPEYFVSEDGCNIHISVNSAGTNGIFEKLSFYINGTLVAEAENVDYFEYNTDITETSVVKCVAKIMGVEYMREQVVTHYNSFWMGAGTSYTDVMQVTNIIPITNGMRGAYDVEVTDGQSIIIVVGNSLRAGFIRADLNGVEIQFTESTVTIDDKQYVVLKSEPWNAGTYNIDING